MMMMVTTKMRRRSHRQQHSIVCVLTCLVVCTIGMCDVPTYYALQPTATIIDRLTVRQNNNNNNNNDKKKKKNNLRTCRRPRWFGMQQQLVLSSSLSSLCFSSHTTSSSNFLNGNNRHDRHNKRRINALAATRIIYSRSLLSVSPSTATSTSTSSLLAVQPSGGLAEKMSNSSSTSSAAGTTTTSSSLSPNPTEQRSERSQRKAKERQKKEQRKKLDGRKKNYATAAAAAAGATSSSTSTSANQLHSTAVSSLEVGTSTPDDALRAIKRAQKLHDHHDLKVIANFLTRDCDVGWAYGYKGSLLARLAVAALHCNNHIVARQCIDVRRVQYRSSIQPMESAAIIRGLLRVHNVSDAFEILNDELSLPLEGTSLEQSDNQQRLKYRALSLASIASRHLFEGDDVLAVHALETLAELGPLIRQSKIDPEDLKMPWLRLMQAANQCEGLRRKGKTTSSRIQHPQTPGDSSGNAIDQASVSTPTGHDRQQELSTTRASFSIESTTLPCNLAYSVLSVMSTFPSDNDDEVYEALSNALVRRVIFVKGAVDMSGLPPDDRGEVAFIGRSNVGKSSLVNMITNRKALAYTSRTPGKTQEFNYFAVNDKPLKEKEIKYGDTIAGEPDDDTFYLVDLPGFGFAKVPTAQRRDWADFMSSYLSKRKTLKVVFHLIDSRHGPIDEDSNIMKQISTNLPRHVSYVVVLTKADKNLKRKGGSVISGNSSSNVKAVKKKTHGWVSSNVMTKVRDTMQENGVGNAPVLLTSSETKLGRDHLWRYIRLAAES